MFASNPNVPSKVILDGVPVHKSRAINLIVYVCPYRQCRERINRVKTISDNAPGLINQTEILDADVRFVIKVRYSHVGNMIVNTFIYFFNKEKLSC